MNFAFHNNSKGNQISFGSEEVSLRNLETVAIILLRAYFLFSFRVAIGRIFRVYQ